MSFQAICRVCTKESSELLSIFESYNFSAYNCEIFKAITDCASVQIQKFDGFSEQICQRCLYHLTQAYSFKKLCEDSDYKFRTDLIASDRIKIKNEFPEAEFICCDTDNNAIENIDRDASVSDIRLANGNTEERYEDIKTENKSDEDEFRIKEIEAARLSTPIITRTGYEGPSSLKDPQYIEEHTNGSPYTCELCSICRIHKEQLSEESNDQFRSEYSMTEDFKSEFSANETIIKCGDSDNENPVTMDSDFGLTERQNVRIMCEIEENLPADVEEEASAAINNLLPQKSRLIYEKEYKCFQKWKNGKNIDNASEKVLLAYFSEKSKKVKPSTLWSYYSMLKSTLLVKENCDISKYTKLISLLKKLSDGYKPKKSKILESEDVLKFLKEASDDDFLFLKVVAIMGLYGACRSDELYKLEVLQVDDRKSVILVSVIDNKTKKDRSFCITDKECGVSVLEIVRKYVALRPKNVPHKKFFVNYRDKKCTVQPVGINTLYKVPKKIAEFLELPNPEMYTGHCFRRSAATMLANSGTDLMIVKRIGGWKSSSAVSKQLLSGTEMQPNTSLQLSQQKTE